jgi:hypothetical protein
MALLGPDEHVTKTASIGRRISLIPTLYATMDRSAKYSPRMVGRFQNRSFVKTAPIGYSICEPLKSNFSTAALG